MALEAPKRTETDDHWGSDTSSNMAQQTATGGPTACESDNNSYTENFRAPQPTQPVSQRTALAGRRSACLTGARNSQDEQQTAAAILRLAGPSHRRLPDP